MIFENGVLGTETEADRHRAAASSKRSIDLSNPAIKAWLYGTGIYGDGVLSTSQAWQNPHVRACIEKNTRAIAARTLKVYRGTDPLETHWLLDLLDRPNRDLTLSGYHLKYQTFAIRYLYGECFWVIERSGLRGAPKQIWVYNPQLVHMVEDPRTKEFLGWEFRLGMGQSFVLPPEDVLHFPIYDPTKHQPKKPSRGSSPLLAAILAVSSDHAAAEYNLDFFRRGTTPGSVFINKGELEYDNQEAFLDKLKARLRGKGHEPIVLDGEWDVKTLATALKDAEFINGRIQNRSDIAEVYGTPPVALGKDDASYANADVQIKGWWTGELIPTITDWAGVVSERLLASETDTWCTLSVEDVDELQKARLERIESATKLFDRGVPWENIDQLLDLGLGDFAGKETGFMSFSLAPVDIVLDSGPVEDPQPDDEKDPEPEPTAKPDDEPEDDPAQKKADDSAQLTLNGAQIQAAVQVLEQLQAGVIPELAAIELLVAVGIPRQKAEQMVGAVQKRPAEPAPEDDPPRFDLAGVVRGVIQEPEESTGIEVLRRKFGITVNRATSDELLEKILKLIRETDDDLKKVSEPFFKQSMKIGGEQMIDLLGLDISFDLANPEAKAFLEEKLINIVGINDTTEAKLRKLFAKAANDGWTNDELVKQLKGTYNFASARSRVIARTEISQGVNGGRFNVLETEGVDEHEWLDSNDERVRDSHEQEDGNVVAVGELFPVTELRHPCDPDGPAEEIIQCRCITLGADGSRGFAGLSLRGVDIEAYRAVAGLASERSILAERSDDEARERLALVTKLIAKADPALVRIADKRIEYWRASVAQWLPVERRYTKKLSSFLFAQRAEVLKLAAELD